MEPLNDDELHRLLHAWEAPAPPQSLHPAWRPRKPWYLTLWTMSVRVPVPVLVVVLLAVIIMQALPRRERAQIPPAALREVRLSDFHLVPEAKPIVIRRANHETR